MPFLFTDTGNAERLVALYGADLRYCHDFHKWLVWDGQRWATDTTEQARMRTKLTMVAFLNQAIETKNEAAQKFAGANLDAGRQHAMLSLAQPELPVLAADLDQGSTLLNFKNGTVDLRTGKLRPHRRGDFITRMVHHNFNPAAKCPRWIAFLSEDHGRRRRCE